MGDLRELDRLLQKFNKQISGLKLRSYAPYPWQKEFHAAGNDNPERMLMAANRCISPWTAVETVPRSRRILELLGEKSFYVKSWADGSECVAQASGVFLKGIEPALRIHLDNGEWFDCSRKHRVLTVEGWLSIDRLIRFASGLRWKEKLEDFRASCGAGDCRGDQQLLLAVGSGQEPLPSRVDARISERLLFAHSDVGAHIFRYSHAYRSRGHSSNSCGPNLIAGLCAEFEDPGSYIDALRRNGRHRVLLQFAAALNRGREEFLDLSREFSSLPFLDERIEFFVGGNSFVERETESKDHSKSSCEVHQPQSELGFLDQKGCIEIFYPSSHPALVGNKRIVSIVPLGYQPILDFTVENTACYRAAGVFHHNTGKTLSAGAEVSYHATGDYPEWWTGKRFKVPALIWTGSPSNETSKDIVQSELLGGLGEKLGTGWIPRGRIVGQPKTRQAGVKDVVESFQVRHASGGISSVTLKSYEQGWQKWQGTAPHVVWLDEEPDDYKIYSEAQTRILSSKGILFVTFTPLLGVTELVQHFRDGGPGIYLKGATWDDAPHLSKEDCARLSASYRSHERDARTKGIPMLGEGAVFPVADDAIRIDPFKIPGHWARIKGCDFGIDHPAAGAEIAWDRDQDCIYVIDCYKKANETAPYHAAWLNKSNKRIPVAWPHDGMNREKSGGKTLAQAYRELGVNMMGKSARYPKAPGDSSDKGGGQPVEPIVNEILDRMQTNKFKVFSNLAPFFEEKNSYHRKDGLIVAKRDDILKSVFYAVMMKRYSVSLETLGNRQNNAPHNPIMSAAI